jgi:RNA polymerase-binding transcription factor DksA
MDSSTTVRPRRLPSPFSPEELATFKSLLAHQGQAILESCEHLMPSQSPSPHADPDASADYLGRAQAELREIAGALARIDSRRYGRCGDCGEAIPAERLRDVPASPTCSDCAWKPATSL